MDLGHACMTKVFISYSTKDTAVAQKLFEALLSVQAEPFLAGISLEPGAVWADEIFKHLNEAKWVFFLASKVSCQSHAVQQELGASLIQSKTIIPILLDIAPEQLPGWVNKHQAIDARNIDRLNATINSIGAKIQSDKFIAGLILGALALALFRSQ